jgi:hypothetical protein
MFTSFSYRETKNRKPKTESQITPCSPVFWRENQKQKTKDQQRQINACSPAFGSVE